MRLFQRDRALERTAEAGSLRFERCCGAESDRECRRRAVHERLLRGSPLLGPRIG